MITELTQNQIDKFPQYISEWTDKGLTTTRRTLEDAIIDFGNFQKIILNKENPAPVVLLDSPAKCWAKVNEVMSAKEGREVNLKFVYPYFDCQFWASWFSFYEFMRNEVGIKFTNEKEYNVLKNCQSYGMVFPLDEVCIVCQPPTIINKNVNGLHCENGPALSYGGDNEIFALNGVVMTKEYVMTPASEISGQTITKETNVEVRRELLRKVGIERVMESLPHKLLDTRGNYELYSIELSDTIKDAKYLKMLNPSVNCWHLEGVGPDINTIDDALKWRNNNLFINAEILT